MAQDKDRQEDNFVSVPGGLNTDSSLVTQPKGTTRFVLTGVNETKEGDSGFIANEESNAPCYELPEGYIPMGEVYIGDENNLLFLAHPNGDSAMAILDKECNLVEIVSDADQAEKFGFSVTQQIDATFRLRRGCERVVYWVDPKPRMYIIDKEQEFKNSLGEWDVSKFNLFKKYKKIPIFDDIEVLDNGGILPPGSYNFSIQYLDEDFNPTEFVTSTETVMIYNSSLTLNYKEIRGATKETNGYLNYPDSNKSIKITLDKDSLDTTFPFYRLAITEATSGSGQISDTKYTAEISTRNNVFIYTGTNFESTGTQEEVTIFNSIIEKAQTIEQIENKLLLGNVEGKQVNFCNMQKYASRIATDMVTREVILNLLDKSSPKDPSLNFNGVGYMPGEIYSFGIIYIFKDNSLSPVYHIPGKSPLVAVNRMYSSGDRVYPMTNIENSCEDAQYLDNSTCDNTSYWGKDCEGNDLANTPVRHHRFPLRTDYNIPFVEKLPVDETINFVKQLTIQVTGTGVTIPIVCSDPPESGCTDTLADFGDPVGQGPFIMKVNYTDDATPGIYSDTIDPYKWAGEYGDPTTANVSYNFNSPVIIGDVVGLVSIEESFENSINTIVISGPPVLNPAGMEVYTETSAVTGLTYTITIGVSANNSTEQLYRSTMFGIKFSNIQKPVIEDSSEEIIGYYIVRNERKEQDRTILDSAVLTPTIINKNFVAQGLLYPQDNPLVGLPYSRHKRDIYGLISMEHKFNNAQYSGFTKIIQQGEFGSIDIIKSRSKTNDVVEGTGYVQGKHKSGESDDDGFTLHIKTRENVTEFTSINLYTFSDEIKQVFYLDALEDKIIKDFEDKSVDVFNLACDNKIGIISFKEDKVIEYTRGFVLPYFYLYRANENPYSNFRLDPYYKESRNPESFDTGEVEIFNGDSYINPVRYVNSVFYDNRMRKRAGKTSALSFIIAVVLVIVAVALAYFTGGASLALIGAAALIGTATVLTLSGLKQDAWNKAYNYYYGKGLRETIEDQYVNYDFEPTDPTIQRGFRLNPSDDEIQWLGETVNLWFESSVNVGLRHGTTENISDFMNAPDKVEAGTAVVEQLSEYFGIYSVKTQTIEPTNTFDFYMLNKLTYLDAAKKGGRSYIGIALPEMYLLNPDYTRRNKQKFFTHLGLEYDCCSDCAEKFPHRWHWSEQAFQEELTDNFRLFLPNNYKDLEAETGPITDIYRIQNNVYIHTEEGLWHCPQTVQERVTSDIISFIGTGEYFSIPPRKIVDDKNSSAGNKHKWARRKTKFGVLFPCEKEKKWYLFDGKDLKPISDNGNSNWFKNNMNSLVAEKYYKDNLVEYPYLNNPSNPIGVGYISAYDTNKERLIVTKKDIKITNLPTIDDYRICTSGEDVFLFENFSQIIADRLADGWKYVGMSGCRMKFQKEVFTEIPVYENQFQTISNDMDIYVFYNTSDDFYINMAGTAEVNDNYIDFYNLGSKIRYINSAVNEWIANTLVPQGWTGTIHRYRTDEERWLNYPTFIPLGQRNKAFILSFGNDADPSYHGGTITYPMSAPTADYITDFNAFTGIGGVHSTFNTFLGLHYAMPRLGTDSERAFVQHSLAAAKGVDYTLFEVNTLPINIYFPNYPTQYTAFKSSLQDNPYSLVLDWEGDAGLNKYGWFVEGGKSTEGSHAQEGCVADRPLDPLSWIPITACELEADIERNLSTRRVEVITTRTTSSIITEYVDGVEFVPEVVNNGWTMSYSLKREEWIGWHPYIPSFYLSVQEKFYSWKNGLLALFKHNIEGSFQTFYGVYYPFIVEYVYNSNALLSKISDSILFQTEAKKWDSDLREYTDLRDVTFNKLLVYNTEQISGYLNMVPKQNDSANYLFQQVKNTAPTLGGTDIVLDRNERDWTINNLRDLRSDFTVPMFIKDIDSLQGNYYIDKIVNPAAISITKDWSELESFRDKFLVVRLIFDTFADTRLILNFSTSDNKVSER